MLSSLCPVALYLYVTPSWVRCVQSLLEVAERKGEKFFYSREEAAQRGFTLLTRVDADAFDDSQSSILGRSTSANVGSCADVGDGHGDGVNIDSSEPSPPYLPFFLSGGMKSSPTPRPLTPPPHSPPPTVPVLSKDEVEDVETMAAILQVKSLVV